MEQAPDNLTKLTHIMRRVFENPELKVSTTTAACDVPNWDSLNHVSLIMEVEAAFGVRFGLGELQDLKNVGALVSLIDQKLKKPMQ